MALIKLYHGPLPMAELYQALKGPKFGGTGIFIGTVREWTGDEHTESIAYTAYEEMAIKELEKLAEAVEAKGSRVVIAHRLGEAKVEEEVVFVGVASVHRYEALTACHQLIDDLKKSVPIWKKEIDGEEERWGK
ncbi:molybdopterin synthase catalytic subunit [Lactococcus termiticola]|uniref:Molybdenum cofactor biosynthesis protein E n=1 Tax=Lactococcus termiticola TaxID=2169526 RepID=A0A2R5HE38_9LACT|nr:molybdenum cofactor biosynthesis protein MoaE [Lactococcus termiticola]GBG96333.1 molybdenum cofactor biosynthesis protein E [Lactococcus termiticola]